MRLHRRCIPAAALLVLGGTAIAAEHSLRPAPVGSVTMEGGFWGPRITANAKVTVPQNLRFLETSGRMANFDRAAGTDKTPHVGNLACDSDVFKVLEGAAHTMRLRPGDVDAENLARQIRRVIAAEQKDGFLCTEQTLKPAGARLDDLRCSHVLYNAGHLFEAGAAWRDATGKTDLLDASKRFADLVDRSFGEGKFHDVPDHQEIELALVKLHQATGERRYLDLCGFFLDERGHIHGGTQRVPGLKPRSADYSQDRVPLADADSAVGHAVRAGYTYAAMTDIAALRDARKYNTALDRIWKDVVGSKLYITGGSATGQYYDEGFGDPYHLPNETAYCETCGTIANVLWSHRMLLLLADAQYADVLERALYNGVLSGISLSGDRFFYTNTLASRGADQRHPSWDPPCCQTNLVRIIPQVGSMAYATGNDAVFVNLYVAGIATLDMGGKTVRLRVETEYPLDGKVRVTVEDTTGKPFAIALRIPGWASEKPVPSDLYHFAAPSAEKPTLTVGGKMFDLTDETVERGYARLTRNWKAGDVIELDLPMPLRRVLANDRVAANQGRVALQRGPFVYCVEAIDNVGLRTDAIVLPDDAPLSEVRRDDLLGGVVAITGAATVASEPRWGVAVEARPHAMVAVPYCTWANRGRGYMDVWLARTPERATPLRADTAASAAKTSASDAAKDAKLAALNDGRWGPRSDHRPTPRFTWTGGDGRHWVQYEWPQPRKLSRTAVCWAVDRRQQVYWGARIRGEDIVLPVSWRLLYQDGDEWHPVETKDAFTLRLDDFNEVSFKPVTTSAIRIEVAFSGAPCGIQEWRVD